MNGNKIRVAITHGDTNGIGYELIFKTFATPEMLELCTPIIYGSPKIASYHRKAMDLEANFSIISSAEEVCDGRVNLLTCFDDEVKVEFGMATQESEQAAIKALDRAMTDFRQGLFDVLVCAPLSQGCLNNAGLNFSSLSEYLQTSIGDGKKALDLMLNDAMRVAVLTNDIALKNVSEAITEDNIINKTTLFFNTIKRDFRISSPRIAVLSLNPGANGNEEKEIIKPAVDKLIEKEIIAFGPYNAQDFFGSRDYEAFDGILAMYHDQGLIPFKTIVCGEGALLSANLPLVCTAPCQDAGFDIAGKGTADETSFRNAVYLAIDTFRNRNNYDEPLANPLQKLYHEKRDDSEKVRFSIPKKHENLNQQTQQQ